jgi:hypothetical protein
MNDAKLLEAVRMLQDATKLLDAILVEQIGGCTVVSNQPDYDVSNVAPKFDPLTADKSKMYFAVHPEYGEGVVWHRAEGWWFESKEEASGNITNCTHIDYKSIQRRN